MQQAYEFVLKTEKLPSYNRISYIVFMLNAVSLFFIAVITDNKLFERYAFTGSIICVLWTVLNLLRYYSTSYQRMRFTPGYLFIFFVWILLHQYWIAAVIIALAVMDYYSRRELLVRFTNERVEYPSFPARIIEWQQLQNVVIKDGLLTIDFVNNKMLQAEVNEETLTEEEAEFNHFTAQCIFAAAGNKTEATE
jgi:hypothetical protein